jgi:hypothetical protein
MIRLFQEGDALGVKKNLNAWNFDVFWGVRFGVKSANKDL